MALWSHYGHPDGDDSVSDWETVGEKWSAEEDSALNCDEGNLGYMNPLQKYGGSGDIIGESTLNGDNTPDLPSTPQRYTQLLRKLDCCADKLLQQYIELHDVPLLKYAVDLFEFGIETPDVVRSRIEKCVITKKSGISLLAEDEQDGVSAQQENNIMELVSRYSKQALVGLICSYPYPPFPSESKGNNGKRAFSSLDGQALTWDLVAEQLWYGCVLLEHAVGIPCSSRNSEEESSAGGRAVRYQMPRHLLARILPVLYSWSVDWDFLSRFVSVWRRVTLLLVNLIPTSCSALFPPPVYLPWRPLVGVVNALTGSSFSSSSSLALSSPRFEHLVTRVGGTVIKLCGACSFCFDPHDALQGLWELFSPSLFREDWRCANLNLFLFSALCPLRSVLFGKPSLPSESSEADTNLGGNSPSPADDVSSSSVSVSAPIEKVLQFIFNDLSSEYTPSFWVLTSFDFVSSISQFYPGILNLDRYAEPFFTLALRSLGFNEESGLMHFCRDVGHFSPPFNKLIFRKGNPFSIAKSVGTVLAFSLRPCITSSLWNHFRRFIHVTKVFLQATDKPKLPAVARCLYMMLIKAVRFRILQLKHMIGDSSPDLYIDDTVVQMRQKCGVPDHFSTTCKDPSQPQQGSDKSSTGGVDRMQGDGKKEYSSSHFPLGDRSTIPSKDGIDAFPFSNVSFSPSDTWWTNQMTEGFVDIMKEVVLLSLDGIVSKEAISMAAILTQMAPGKMVIDVCKKANLAFDLPSQDLAPQIKALQLLQACAYPLLLSKGRCRAPKDGGTNLSFSTNGIAKEKDKVCSKEVEKAMEKNSLSPAHMTVLESSLFMVAPSEVSGNALNGKSQQPSDFFTIYVQEQILSRTGKWWKVANTDLSTALICFFWTLSTFPNEFHRLFSNGCGDDEILFASNLVDYVLQATNPNGALSSNSFCTSLRSVFHALSADAFDLVANRILHAIKRHHTETLLHVLVKILASRDPARVLQFTRVDVLPLLLKYQKKGEMGSISSPSSAQSSSLLAPTTAASHEKVDDKEKSWACKMLSLCISSLNRDDLFQLFPEITKAIELQLVENITSKSGQKAGIELYRSLFSALLLPRSTANMQSSKNAVLREEGIDWQEEGNSWNELGVCTMQEVSIEWSVAQWEHVIATKKFLDHLLEDIIFIAKNVADVETCEESNERENDGECKVMEEGKNKDKRSETNQKCANKCCLRDAVVKGFWERSRLRKLKRKEEKEEKKKIYLTVSQRTSNSEMRSDSHRKEGQQGKVNSNEGSYPWSFNDGVTISAVVEGVTSVLTSVLKINSVFFQLSDLEESTTAHVSPLSMPSKHWATRRRCASLIPYIVHAVQTSSVPASLSDLSPVYNVNEIYDVLNQWIVPLIDRPSPQANIQSSRFSAGSSASDCGGSALRIQSALSSLFPCRSPTPAPLRELLDVLDSDGAERVSLEAINCTINALLTIANIPSTSSQQEGEKSKEKRKPEKQEGKEGKYLPSLERDFFLSCGNTFSHGNHREKEKRILEIFSGAFLPPFFWNLQAQSVFHSLHGPYVFPSLSLDRKQQILELVYRHFFLGSSVSLLVTQSCSTALRLMVRQWMIPCFRRKLLSSTAGFLSALSFEMLREKNKDVATLYRRLLGENSDEEGNENRSFSDTYEKNSSNKPFQNDEVRWEEEESSEEWNSMRRDTTTIQTKRQSLEDEKGKLINAPMDKQQSSGNHSESISRSISSEVESGSCSFLHHCGLTKNIVAALFQLLYNWLKNSLLFSCTSSQLHTLKVLAAFPSYAFSFQEVNIILFKNVQNLFFSGIHSREAILHSVQQLVHIAARCAHFQPSQSALLLRICVSWLQPSYSYMYTTGERRGKSEGNSSSLPPTLTLGAMVRELFSLSIHNVGSVQRYSRQLLGAVWLSCCSMRLSSTAILVEELRGTSPIELQKKCQISNNDWAYSTEAFSNFREKYRNRVKKFYPFSFFNERGLRFLPRILVITTCGREEADQMRLLLQKGGQLAEEREEESYRYIYVADEEQKANGNDIRNRTEDFFSSSQQEEGIRQFLQSIFDCSSPSSPFISTEEIRKTWVWSFIHNTKVNAETRNDGKGSKGEVTGQEAIFCGQRLLDSTQLLLWNSICRILGPEASLPLLLGSIQLALTEYYHDTNTCSEEDSNKEKHNISVSDTTMEKVERYTVLLTMGIGCITATKSLVWRKHCCDDNTAELSESPFSSSGEISRSTVIDRSILPLMNAALAQEAIEGMTQNFLLSLSYLSGELTQEEVWQLYDLILLQLEGAEKELKQGGKPQSRWVSNRFRLLSQLFKVFCPEITGSLLIPLLERLRLLPHVLLLGPTTLWRVAAADFLKLLVSFPLSENWTLLGHQSVGESILSFLQEEILNRLEFPKSVPVCDDWLRTNSNQLCKIKTFGLLLRAPTGVVVQSLHKPVTSYLLKGLEISLPEKDDLESILHYALISIACSPFQKTVTYQLLELWTSILIKGVVSGNLPVSDKKDYDLVASSSTPLHRRAREKLIHALSVLVYHNLHRIGKFTYMQCIGDAAINSIAATDDTRTREQAQHLFTILCHVASDEQISSLLHGYETDLKRFPVGRSSAAASGPSGFSMVEGQCKDDEDEEELRFKKRKLAIICILCAAVLADSGGIPPPYVPRIMRRLVTYADDSSMEVKRVVRSTFEKWWKSHRERWTTEVKSLFTPAQVTAMMPLLTAPAYFV